MKISIFSDKFSGTLSATQVIEIINKVFNENLIQASYFPVTDGGEDSSIIFKEHGFKAYKNLIAKDLAGNKRNIELITLNREIFFESSLLIGINNTDIDTMKLNTSCLAEIIKITDVIGLGGSRTNDGGFGLLSKMGINFYNDKKLIQDPKPSNFEKITNVEIGANFQELNKKVLVDTFIPLLGIESAIDIFGPQKGLDEESIKNITFHIERIIDLMSKNFDKKPDPTKAGTGAAGGLGFALSEILGCEILSGAEYFFEKSGLESKINTSDILILCEGKFDKTSLEGKVIGQILKRNKATTYFLGGIYDYQEQSLFKKIFECGKDGLINPKKELELATIKLVEEIKI